MNNRPFSHQAPTHKKACKYATELNSKDVCEVLSPEKYVFDESYLKTNFLVEQSRHKKIEVTKTQLRKYFNEFKAIGNSLIMNSETSQEEFENSLKRAIVVIPIMKAKSNFPNALIELITLTIRKVYKSNINNTQKAQLQYLCFVKFFETLIAYSKGD